MFNSTILELRFDPRETVHYINAVIHYLCWQRQVLGKTNRRKTCYTVIKVGAVLEITITKIAYKK